MRGRRRVIFWLSGNMKGKLVTMGLMAALIVFVFTNQLPAAKTWTYWTLPLSGKVFVIDPGHGGADGGAKSRNGLHEKEVTLQISSFLRDFLQQAGAVVYMTRETDVDLAKPETKGFSRRKTEDLKARVNVVHDSGADAFVSIHLNSIPSARWFGPQTFYTHNHEDNSAMAWFIQHELKNNVMDTHRSSKTIRGIYVLDQIDLPAVLVEVGFLSNAAEATKLGTVPYQQQLAAAIYRGLLRYASGERVPVDPTSGENMLPDSIREVIP